jgi:hypothetical protein
MGRSGEISAVRRMRVRKGEIEMSVNYEKRNGFILAGLDRHKAHPATAALRKAAEQCLAIAQNFANQRDELERDSRYTINGKREKLKEAQAEAEPKMRNARGPIDGAKKALERLRGELKPVPAVGRTDAIAETRDVEDRAYVRSIESSLDRSALLLSNPAIREAVLGKPAFMSGVPEIDYAKAKVARDAELHEQLNGPKLREIEALQAPVDEADAAAGIAQNDLTSLAEIDDSLRLGRRTA